MKKRKTLRNLCPVEDHDNDNNNYNNDDDDGGDGKEDSNDSLIVEMIESKNGMSKKKISGNWRKNRRELERVGRITSPTFTTLLDNYISAF